MLSSSDLSLDFIKSLFEEVKDEHFVSTMMQNKILVNVFFEPSTRTSLSFECAMYKLGGKVITFNQDSSSIKKGESFKDTIKTLATYGDILVLRHSDVNKIKEARSYVNIPVINAGNGNGEHPTQALLDLYTIHKHLLNIELKHPISNLNNNLPNIDNTDKLKVLFVGDIMNSRTIHSLFNLLIKFDNTYIHFLPFCDCDPSVNIISKLVNKEDGYQTIVYSKSTVDLSQYDIIYATRLQKERSNCNNDPDLIIDKEFMKKVKNTAIVMHPLPRNEEIDPEIDNDPRCVYFEQMKYGIHVRMALLRHYLF